MCMTNPQNPRLPCFGAVLFPGPIDPTQYTSPEASQLTVRLQVRTTKYSPYELSSYEAEPRCRDCAHCSNTQKQLGIKQQSYFRGWLSLTVGCRGFDRVVAGFTPIINRFDGFQWAIRLKRRLTTNCLTLEYVGGLPTALGNVKCGWKTWPSNARIS